MVSILKTEFTRWVEVMLAAHGVHRDAARRTADIFLRASLRHTGHHDLTMLKERLQLLEDEIMNPSGEMELIDDLPVFSRYDGNGALGEYCCSYLLEKTMTKAQISGLAMGTVRHSNHFLAGHPYGQIAAENNCMAIVWSNTDPCMGDPSGQANVLGNNPMGFGVPGDTNPMVLDLCMAYTSLGKLGERIREGRYIPEYWGNDSEGKASNDPADVLDGGICNPMAEHKGFGMALMTEMLTGGLSGGEMGTDIVPVRGWQKHSQTILVIDLERLGVFESWEARFGRLREGIDEKLGSKVRFPGDHLYAEIKPQDDKLTFPESLYIELSRVSEVKGVAVPDVLLETFY